MNEDMSSYSEEIQKTLTPELINKLQNENSESLQYLYAENLLDLIGQHIPGLGEILKIRSTYLGYKENRLRKKVLEFIRAFSQKEYDQENLKKLVEEIESKNRESFNETLLETLDRIDNANKARILANILHHCISGKITRDNFLRHSWVLTHVPYIDLVDLHKYTDDYYHSSSSEVLASTGLISETIKDSNRTELSEYPCVYGVTPLGEEMLHYGFFYADPEWKYKGTGRSLSFIVTR